MKKYKLFLGFSIVALHLSSCSDVEDPGAQQKMSESVPFAQNALVGNATSPPTIKKFSPSSGNAGTTVTLTGKFNEISSVRFGTLDASSFSVSVDEKTLTAVAPVNVDTATISVENSLGIAETINNFESWCNPVLVKEKTLVITDLSVVNDPVRTVFLGATSSAAPWSFSFLMDRMRPTNVTFTDFVQGWFDQWKNVTAVNGFPVTPRPTIDTIVNSWPRLADNTFDMEKAPFRLLAITSRIDLRSDTNAGEGRFIFGAVDATGAPLQFTVILEYKLLLENGETLASWAQQWHDLSLLTLPSSKFNTKLGALTRKFSARKFVGTHTNGNAISQIRTNEIDLDKPWEMREFHLDETTGMLFQSTTAQNPDDSLNPSTTVDQFMLSNIDAIRAGTYVVTPTMLGGATQAKLTTTWTNIDGSVPSDVRASFSLGTCNACHSGETSTQFTHIKPREAIDAALISDFLVTDQDRRFTDLTNVVIENFCTTSFSAFGSNTEITENQTGKPVWISRVDTSRDVNQLGERFVDFTLASKTLEQANVKVLGKEMNFRNAKDSASQDMLQCFLIHDQDVENADRAGFLQNSDCAKNPYHRVH